MPYLMMLTAALLTFTSSANAQTLTCNDPRMQNSPHCVRAYQNPFHNQQYQQQQAVQYYHQPAQPAQVTPQATAQQWMPEMRDLPNFDYDYQPYSRFAGGLTVGTLGVGAEGQFQVMPGLVLRGGPHFFTHSHDDELDGVDYDADLDLIHGLVVADWHPFGNGFHLSAGAAFGDMEVSLTGAPTTNVNIGGTDFTASEVGTIDGEVTTNAVKPYLGLGYNNTFTNDGSWSIQANAGLLYTGSADVSLGTNGTLANDASFLSELREEEAAVEDDLDILRFYPVITVGVNYRF